MFMASFERTPKQYQIPSVRYFETSESIGQIIYFIFRRGDKQAFEMLSRNGRAEINARG
jgi:hypothetical protein